MTPSTLNLIDLHNEIRLHENESQPLTPNLGMVQTTQALFGAATCKAGTTTVLRALADTVPSDAPRFLTHDATAMSCSLSSYYRKTNLGAPRPSDSKYWRTQYTDDYRPELGLNRTYIHKMENAEEQPYFNPADGHHPPRPFEGWYRKRA